MGEKTAVKEVIAGSLSWLPEVQWPPEGFSGKFVLAHSLCIPLTSDPELSEEALAKCQQYHVQHYTREALGGGFGPLNLCQVQRFVVQLATLLDQKILVGIGCPEGENTRANAALLLGAFLLLRLSWPLDKVIQTIGSTDANLTFALPWLTFADEDKSLRTLRVLDCWAGVQLAFERGWIPPSAVADAAGVEKSCWAYNAMLEGYDAVWMVPGHILVSADPVTVVIDPNPDTFDEIFPGEKDAGLESGHDKIAKEDSGPRSKDTPVRVVSLDTTTTKPDVVRNDSCDTVCKDYSTPFTTGAGNGVKPESFADFMMTCNVGLIVRTNSSGEPGMPNFMYDSKKFKDYGIEHIDLPVPDVQGGLPKLSQVARLLAVAEKVHQTAIVIHCKGGFGRSATLACCLAIMHFDVPGRALLGWIRVVRPGAITTRKQERFIASLNGRGDLLKLVQGCAKCGTDCTVL
mmetsp:Transcript_7351/g.16056  ORF Transcript_7351/g.16056 Transcript_7351/m.16056 type:complete len:460 (-) Transcript_7351:192-1571(-)